MSTQKNNPNEYQKHTFKLIDKKRITILDSKCLLKYLNIYAMTV